MMGDFDLTREVAEKVLKRAMTPVRWRLESAKKGQPDTDVSTISLGELRELDRDLGVLGLTLATRYAEQVEYQTGLRVMAAENSRLHQTLDVLLEMIERYKEQVESLSGSLAKTNNVNEKLKRLTPSGFKSSSMIE